MMDATTARQDTVFVPRKTATTNTLIVVTTAALATRINTNRYTGKATNRAISRDTTLAATTGGVTEAG